MKVTRFLKTIAPKWVYLAMEMGFQQSDIETIEQQTHKDPLEAIRSILGTWLQGSKENLCEPVTWITLIECVSNIEFQHLADELNSVLLD